MTAHMDYLIRFAQVHETFRQPETESLAELAGLSFEWLSYSEDSPFAVIQFPIKSDADSAAKALISRSILGTAIYEVWGTGADYAALHQDVRNRTEHLWPTVGKGTFRFELDSYHGSRTSIEHREIIETFIYMGFTGRIRMQNPDNQFRVLEYFDLDGKVPTRLFLGRLVAESERKMAVNKYTLKKRSYIATTSMDAELSLVTANLAQAAPGKVAYDPFMGTGSFPLACAHFGAVVLGSDLDGRSIRGKGTRNVHGNFVQYDTTAQYLGGVVADLTNSPFREVRFLDAIVCDPPYGVREGLKVLGSTRVALKEVVYLNDGSVAHLQPDFIPPKKPYSFLRMLDDILHFAATTLVDGGRLSMWMPVAGAFDESEDLLLDPDATKEFDIPRHPALRLVSMCRQDFNRWSRRLLTYTRLDETQIDQVEILGYTAARLDLRDPEGARGGMPAKANELNVFRKKYFLGFRDPITGEDMVAGAAR